MGTEITSSVKSLGMLLYPLVIHLAVYLDSTALALGYLSLINLLFLLDCLYRKRWLGLFFSAMLLGSLLYIWYRYQSAWLIFLPPVVIFAVLAWLFGRTLFFRRTALITQIASVMKMSELGQAEIIYTRKVTIWWTLFFCVMCVESVLLAIYAPIAVWSWMTNIVNYFIVSSIFLIEFTVRKKMIKQDKYNSFIEFITTMFRKRKEIRQKLV